MIAVVCHLHPFGSHFFGFLCIFLSHFFLAQLIGQIAIRRYTQDGFDRQVGVVCKVSGKVVCTKLIFRIEPILSQIIGPGCQYIPVFLRIVGISFDNGDGCTQDQHISRFLDRHISTVCLAVSQRISTYIMCSERLIPFSAFAIIEDVVHQTFCQFRIVYQEQRSRRISDIHRTDRTVAEVLF